jgi:subfamily B ATP-binding cassette protein MsbA
LREASREVRRQASRLTSQAEETLSYLPLIQAYAREGYERDRYLDQARQYLRARLRSSWLGALSGPLIGLIGTTGGLLVIWVGAYQVETGHMTVGALVAALSYVRSLYSPLSSLAKLSASVQATGASVERVAEVMSLPIAIAESDRTESLDRAAGGLELRDVWFGYRPDEPVLRGLSFAVEPGQTVALVGPTGAGKTTVTKLLMRMHDPHAGTVLVDGRDGRRFPLSWLRQQFALVPQDATIFDGTVEDNIRYGRLEATPGDVERAAWLAQADEFIRRLPQGYRTRVGQKGTWLSGGQKQRLALARALLSDAPVLILDEATANVDAFSERLIQDALELFAGRRTLVVIAHRLSTVVRADKIVVLRDGRVDEEGTHGELWRRGGTYAALFGAQLATVQVAMTADDVTAPSTNGHLAVRANG